MESSIRRAGWLVSALSVAFASPGLASNSAVIGGVAGGDRVLIEPQPQPWGGASSTALVVGASDVVPPRDTLTWATSYDASKGIAVYQTSAAGGGSWIYQFHVPSGALLQRVEMEACDISTTGGLNFGITSGLVPGGTAGDISPTGSTGDAATPGCAFFSMAPTTATTIDNAARNYWVYFFWSGTGLGPQIELHSFRIYYRLQVSPAPATATFNDVPTTHPFFRFVEAMAASGLTGGCGAGAFCPDNPVTRGQMAVFLSIALGLHFPN